MNALLIEDDEDYAELIRLGLTRGKVNYCAVANTYRQALRYLNRLPTFGLIVLDLKLPDSTLPETLSHIRELKDQSRGAKIVVLSGWSELDIGPRAHSAGADFVLQKTSSVRKTISAIMDFRPIETPRCLDADLVQAIEDTVKQIVIRPSAPTIAPETSSEVFRLLAH